jgi:hypothetical protein
MVMSDLLKQFMAKTRLQADPELIERWEWDMRYHGDKNIKPQAAHARRTATALQNACDKFHHLSREQELAFKAAASGMQNLANDLTRLGEWAKSYLAFCEKARQTQRTAELEAIAGKRWGDDVGAMEFEQGVIDELQTEAGRIAFAQWMHAQGHFQHIDEAHFFLPFDSSYSMTEKNPRHRLAAMIEYAMGERRSRSSTFACCSWQSYEDYLAYRKEVANTAKRVLQMVGQGGK